MMEMREIAPDIYLVRIPLSLNVEHVNLYIFRGEAPTLIDTGTNTPDVQEAVKQALAQLGIKRLEHVLCTHWHVDHAGGAKELAEMGARIFISSRDYQEWESFIQGRAFNLLKGWAVQEWGVPQEELKTILKIYEPLISFTKLPDQVHFIEPGQTIQAGNYSLEGIYTPGHTAGHLSFYSKELKLLFSGDMLLPDYIPYPGVWEEAGEVRSGLPYYLESLNTLESLDVNQYYPAHGEPAANVKERCREVRTQIEKQVRNYTPAPSVYMGVSQLAKGRPNPGVLFMQLHYVFGWEKVRQQGLKFSR